MKIEICERLMDRTWDGKPKYHAQIEGSPGFWAAGTSPDDAIGNLIRCHPEKFGLEIEFLGKLAR